MLNLFGFVDQLVGSEHSSVRMDTKRCLHSQYRFSKCKNCFNICPVSAISAGKPPVLDSKMCQSCLACLTVCPVGAYAADDAVSSLLNSVNHQESGPLELLCEKNSKAVTGVTDASRGMVVQGCLAGLGAGAYLGLVASGIEHILVRTDDCAICRWGSLSALIETQVNQAKQILESWKKQEAVECVPSLESPVIRPLWKATNPPVSRRDLFRMVTLQGKTALVRTFEESKLDSDHRPNQDHLRVVSAIGRLPVPNLYDGFGLGEFGFASLSVSNACSACETCVRVCPTGALTINKNKEETAFNLKISIRDCIGCEICEHVCNCSAISVNHKPTFAQIFSDPVVILLVGGLVKCEQCGILMAARPELHLCQMCEHQSSSIKITREMKSYRD
jgi:ferredoxin